MRLVSPVTAASLALVIASAASAVLAQTAGPTTLSGVAVGNTLQVDYPDVPGHPRVTFKLMADGTFTATFPGGVAGSGDYVADARYMCWITKVPAEPVSNGNNSRCEANTAEGKAVGDSWTMTDSMGAKAVITITPGQ
jgi:hypothetical protein